MLLKKEVMIFLRTWFLYSQNIADYLYLERDGLKSNIFSGLNSELDSYNFGLRLLGVVIQLTGNQFIERWDTS